MPDYAEGGYVRPSGDKYVPIKLSRGAVVMSRAHLEALRPGMLARLAEDCDLYAAEDVLLALDEEDHDES